MFHTDDATAWVMLGANCWNCGGQVELTRAVEVRYSNSQHHFWCKTCDVKWNEPGKVLRTAVPQEMA